MGKGWVECVKQVQVASAHKVKEIKAVPLCKLHLVVSPSALAPTGACPIASITPPHSKWLAIVMGSNNKSFEHGST